MKLLVSTRAEVLTLATLLKFYASRGNCPRNRSDLLLRIVDDLARILTRYELAEEITDEEEAMRVLTALGLGDKWEGIVEAGMEGLDELFIKDPDSVSDLLKEEVRDGQSNSEADEEQGSSEGDNC